MWFAHSLWWIFKLLPDIAGFFLAAISLAAIVMPELLKTLEGEDKKGLRIIAAVFLTIVGVAAVVSNQVQKSLDEKKIEQTAQETQRSLDALKEQINRQQIIYVADTKYLEGQLSAFSQFGPGIMKLAQTTEENTRKQYEAKIVSDAGLYKLTMEVVGNIRDFSSRYRVQSDQIFNEETANRGQLTPEETNRTLMEGQQKSLQLSRQRDGEFRDSILPNAIYCRQELLKRNIPEPTFSGFEKSAVDMVFRTGMLAGPNPELAVADYLEVMAKPLAQK